jgi:hypothetical protein
LHHRDYRIVSLEKCTGPGPTEPNVWATAKQLKAIDPSLKVIFYWDVDQSNLVCYNAYKEYMTHPEFWLRDDSGAVVYNGNNPPVPRLDYTVAAARAWWVSIPLNGTGSPAAAIIDGVLADGVGAGCPSSKISPARCREFSAGQETMIREMQALLNATTNGGTVFGNGISMYPNAPDHNMYMLADMNGVMAEHFSVFEAIDMASGLPIVDTVATFLSLVSKAAALGKIVVMATWPGLCVTPFGPDGYPTWPKGDQPRTNDGWRAALLAKHTFALAGFLTVAQPNVWMQYEGWYNGLTQGI